MSNNPAQGNGPCAALNCLAPTSTVLGKKHSSQYHLTPVPFQLGDVTMSLRFQGGKLACPFHDCSVLTNRRDRATKHMRDAHDLPQGVLIFEGPVATLELETGEVQNQPQGPEGLVALGDEGVESLASALVPGPETGLNSGYVADRPAQARSEEKTRDKGSVDLDPKIDYLLGGGILDSLGIWYHHGLNVFICRSCRVALTLQVVKGHYKSQHEQKITVKDAQDLEAFAQRYHVYSRPEDVPLPSPGGPAIQGVFAPKLGFACGVSGCSYAVKSEDVMKKHERSEHKLGPLHQRRFRACKVQVLFSSVGRVFFEVQESTKDNDGSRFDKALRQVGISLEKGGDAAIDTDKGRTPPRLLTITGWPDHLPHVRGRRALRQQALALKERYTPQELGGILPTLGLVVKRLFQQGRTALNGRSNKLTALKVIIHGASIPSEGAKHWDPIPESNDNYPRFATEMVAAILRSTINECSAEGFQFILSPLQESNLAALAEALLQKNLDKAVRCCQNFFWTIVSAKDKGNWTDVTQQWIWLKALRPDGNFYGASALTPDLAKLKYLMRQTTLLQAFVEPLQSEEQLIERLGSLHASTLALGLPCPFNMLVDLSKFATSVVLSETKDPKVTISKDYASFTVGTQTMSLDKLREGLKTLTERVWASYKDITQCQSLVPDTLHIVDDLSNDTRGYSFLDESPFHEKRQVTFYYLVKMYRLASLDSEGALCWDIPQVKLLLEKSQRMWDNLLHLLFITFGVSTRVAQFLRIQLRNADRQRNLQFWDGDMFFVTRDSKTSSASARDSCTPSFPPSQVSRLLLELLGSGYRDAEALLVGAVYGDEAMELHRTYLCMRRGKQMEADYFYDKFAAKNEELFDCKWGSRDFRQAAIAMARHFISSDATFEALDDVLAEGADHSTDVDHAHYGRTFGDHPRLSHNDIEKQRWLSEEWHSFLGLGPFPIQDPLFLVRSRRNPKGEKDAIKLALSEFLPQLSDMVTVAVRKGLQEVLPRLPVVPEEETKASAGFASEAAHFEPADRADIHMEELEVSFSIPACIPVSKSTAGSTPPCSPTLYAARSLHHPGQQTSSPIIMEKIVEVDVAPSFAPHVTPVPGPSSRKVPEQLNKKNTAALRPAFLDLTSSELEPSPTPSPLQHARRKQSSSNGKPSVRQTQSSSTSQPVAPAGQRKRRAPIPVGSDEEVEEENDTPPKRIRRNPISAPPLRSLFQEPEQEERTFDRNSLDDFIVPSTPDSTTSRQEELIRKEMRRMFGNPSAREKSREQMDALLAIMDSGEDARDMVVVIKTGGGKSLLWTIPPLLGLEGISVVICPFKTLMEEQYQRCARAGVRCHNYGLSKDVGESVQNLFLQVEHVGMEVFQRQVTLPHQRSITDAFISLLVQPIGQKIKRVFVDEFHDMSQCHPNRRSRWEALARQCSQMAIQIILLSATCPPSMADNLLQPFRMNTGDVNFIRGPTDREEVGLHYIKALYTSDDKPLHRIVACLHAMLKPEERMLVFFNSKTDLAKFATKAECGMHHSDLYGLGNTREDHLRRWDSGETKVMACTTGFAQGVDRAHVRFVVMKDPEYGMLVTMQMMGRAGRDGQKSHAIVLETDGGHFFPGNNLVSSSAVKEVLGNSERCRVLSVTSALDGADHSYECRDRPSRVACDVCNPGDRINLAIVAASKDVVGPILPLGQAGQPMQPRANVQSNSTPKRPVARKEPPVSGMTMQASERRAVIQRPGPSKVNVEPALSQDSDDLYGPAVIDAAMRWELEEMEGSHCPLPEIRRKDGLNTLTRCSTLAVLPLVSQDGWSSLKAKTAVDQSASQPEGTSATRAAEAQRIKRERKARTRKLNKYVPVLEGKCTAHLLDKAEISPMHFPSPCSDLETHGERYNLFRKRFIFQRYEYCFVCGLPQDRGFNGEMPECHKAYAPGTGKKCAFQFVIFKVAFAAGQKKGMLAAMREELGVPGNTVEEYHDWVVSPVEVEGHYHNAIEVFLWCCERLEKSKPTLFL